MESARLMDEELQDIVERNFNVIPVSKQAQKERRELVLLVREVQDRRKNE